MSYYNIHTHKKRIEEGVTSIYSLTEQEILSGATDDAIGLYYSCGIHPWMVDHTNILSEDIYRLATTNDRVVAIGEVGLDTVCSSSYDKQKQLFADQVSLAKELELPVIIHCVRAWDDLIRIHKECKPICPWVIHGFRGGKQQAEQLIRQGFYLSLGEYFNNESLTVSYPRALLLETDESDLSIKNIYYDMAILLGEKTEDIMLQIEQNVRLLFKLK